MGRLSLEPVDVGRRCIDNIDKKRIQLINKALSKLQIKLNKIIKGEIKVFYHDYYPHLYNRKYDLYNTFKIDVYKNTLRISFDSNFMKKKHDDSNEYVFNLAFMEGYHGGQKYGVANDSYAYSNCFEYENVRIANNNIFPHPDPGTPWWKWRGAWIRPAVKSISPYKIISKKIDLLIQEVQEEIQYEYDKFIDEQFLIMKQSIDRWVKSQEKGHKNRKNQK